MKRLLLTTALAAYGAAFAAPTVSNVHIAADAAAQAFVVTYDLAGGPAIVTVDFFANGEPIGPEQRLNLCGDVNRRVESSSGTITWYAGAAAPETAFAEVTAEVTAWDPEEPPDYMAVDLRTGEFSWYASTNALPGGIESDFWRTDMLLMRNIPVRTAERPDGTVFKMLDRHYVKLTKRFYMAVFECTQRQWERVMMKGSATTYAQRRPAAFKNEDCYAARILDYVDYDKIRGTDKGRTWPASGEVDADSFMGRLRALTGSDRFDLPTDAQWEYAYRAGTTTSFFWGSALSGHEKYFRSTANGYNMDDGTSPDKETVGLEHGSPRAGSYLPNPWGLYDMPSGTWEYTVDWWEDASALSANTAETAEADRMGPARSAGQVLHPARGGCSQDAAGNFNSATGRTAQSSAGSYLGGFHVVYRVDDFDFASSNAQ